MVGSDAALEYFMARRSVKGRLKTEIGNTRRDAPSREELARLYRWERLLVVFRLLSTAAFSFFGVYGLSLLFGGNTPGALIHIAVGVAVGTVLEIPSLIVTEKTNSIFIDAARL